MLLAFGDATPEAQAPLTATMVLSSVPGSSLTVCEPEWDGRGLNGGNQNEVWNYDLL